MDVPYYILATIGALSFLNTCLASYHNRRLKVLEEKVRHLEERPTITALTASSPQQPTQTSQATAPYLPPASTTTYRQNLYPIPTPQVNVVRATAPPSVPIYYAQDPQATRNYQYGTNY